jgi:hypothetical protein
MERGGGGGAEREEKGREKKYNKDKKYKGSNWLVT